MVKNIGKEHNEELMTKFPEGFAIFGILRPGEPLIKGLVDNKIVNIDWDTGKIDKLSTEEIDIILPDMTVKRGNATLNLNHCGTRIKRQTGIIQKAGFSIGDLSLSAEILADKEIPIIAIGFSVNK